MAELSDIDYDAIFWPADVTADQPALYKLPGAWPNRWRAGWVEGGDLRFGRRLGSRGSEEFQQDVRQAHERSLGLHLV
ncbi:MAG: hypothetical protein ACK5Q5_23100 [Planctomycetaceae bacterium]